ncbi:MAG: hypothetical protein JZU63_11075, partial [Rhodoferax sp.]|nr:hypothetical protein [Rhodoferax sp.]
MLFSDIDFVTDADTSQARLGGTALFPQGYSTPLPEFLPIVLSTDGSPDASKVQTRMFYTDQNWIATYDPKQFEALEVDAHSTYALDGSRPFSLCFMMPAYPMIVQKPRRIYGTVAVYMANGFVNAGASVTLELLVAGGYATRIITVPIEADASSLDQQSYVKIGEAAVDITEEVFSDTGIVGTVTLDETGA